MLATLEEFQRICKKEPVLTLPRLGSGVRFASPAPGSLIEISGLVTGRRRAASFFLVRGTAGVPAGSISCPLFG